MKKIKAKPGQIKIDIKDGWYHEWHMGKKPFKVKGAMTLHDCPDVFIDNNGRVTNPIWIEWFVKEYKTYKTEDEFYEAAQKEPRKSWKRVFKIMKNPSWIFDGRNILDEKLLKQIGFKTYFIGRS